MAPTSYQKSPPAGLVNPSYKPNPLVAIAITGQGTQSHPVPPKRVTLGTKLLPAPSSVSAPGASGTI